MCYSEIPLSALLKNKYISTPARSDEIYAQQNFSFVSNGTKLIFTWIHDNYDMYNYLNQMPGNCSKFEKIKIEQECFNFTFLHNDAMKRKHFIFKIYHVKKSWNEASQLCRDIGGYLPYFTSKHDLDQLLALLKFGIAIPQIYHTFIGLKYYPNQVGINF